ncbi:MAG: DUF3330 domain-containing protein [Gammaproteobacteria bacterium]|nr:DUF3330 domain-containing protein [Gammaproteobacteria bacterium]MDH5614272.1 DUF3330 domain-containing protein [Gammaproteobacteria bacterium]
MTDKPDTDEPLLQCNVCLKEIPKSLAKSEEGDEYVYYFCGRDCHDKWLKENGNSNK